MKLINSVDFRSKILTEKIVHARYLNEHIKYFSDTFKNFVKIGENDTLSDTIVAKDGITFCVLTVYNDGDSYIKIMNEKINFLKSNKLKYDKITDFNIDVPMEIINLWTNLEEFPDVLEQYRSFLDVPELRSHNFDDLIDHFVLEYPGIKTEYFDQLKE